MVRFCRGEKAKQVKLRAVDAAGRVRRESTRPGKGHARGHGLSRWIDLLNSHHNGHWSRVCYRARSRRSHGDCIGPRGLY